MILLSAFCRPFQSVVTPFWAGNLRPIKHTIKDNNTIVWLGANGQLSNVSYSIEYGTILNAINLISTFKNLSYGFKEGREFDHFSYGNDKMEWASVPDLGADGSIITLTPVWLLEEHKLVFNTNTDLLFNDIVLNFDSDIPWPTNVIRLGYMFNGWYTSAVGGTKVTWTKMPDLTPKSQNNGSTTLFARWQANRYTVKYNGNGGSVTMVSSSYTYDTNKNSLRVSI